MQEEAVRAAADAAWQRRRRRRYRTGLSGLRNLMKWKTRYTLYFAQCVSVCVRWCVRECNNNNVCDNINNNNKRTRKQSEIYWNNNNRNKKKGTQYQFETVIQQFLEISERRRQILVFIYTYNIQTNIYIRTTCIYSM